MILLACWSMSESPRGVGATVLAIARGQKLRILQSIIQFENDLQEALS